MSETTDIILGELREFRREAARSFSIIHARINKERKELDAKIEKQADELATMRTRWKILIAGVTIAFTAIVAGVKDWLFK